MRRLGPHTVTVLHPTTDTDDGYGNASPDWDTAQQSSVTGCSVQPIPGTENLLDRDTIVSRWQMYAPDGTDLLATDRVVFDGDTYDVDGEVQRWGFPPLSHIVCLLRRSHS
jgi:hypothetical protein